jgi:LysM repeat protein
VNYTSAANAGVKTAFIRVQYGSLQEDSMHVTHETGCYNAGITPNSYAYAQYVSVNDAIVESNDFYNRMGSHSIACFIDVEEITTNDPDDLVPATQAFIDNLHSKGLTKVGLYSGQSFYNTNGLSAVNADFKVIARYGSNGGTIESSIKPNIACEIWQYTSTAVINGFPNPIDADVINGSKPLSYFLSADSPPPPTGDNPPTVPNYNAATNYNTQVSGQVIGSDVDGDPLTYSKSSNPYNGIVTVSSNGGWTYAPNTGFIGNDLFRVLVSDGTGNSATSTISITVNSPSVNPSPIAPVSYTKMFTVVSPSTIYSDQNTSSNQVVVIQDQYSVVYYQTGSLSSNGIWGYVKYIDNQNVSYYGWIQLANIKTQEEIDASQPDYSPAMYQVVDGDTLNSIAIANNTTVDNIKLLNGYRGSVVITVGQSIRVK